MISIWVLINILFVLHCCSASIHNKLRYFETLSTADIVSRSKRSVEGGQVRREVSFRAFSRQFRLVLFPGSSVLAPDVRASTVDGKGSHNDFTVRHDHFFQGHLADNTDVRVRAHFEDGLLCASIHFSHETYTVEPSWRHLTGGSSSSVIIYRASDVLQDKHGRGKIFTGPLSHYGDVVPGMRHAPGVKSPNETAGNLTESHGKSSERPKSRQRRSPSEKKICPMLIVADYDFYRDMGRSDRLSTLMYITWILESLHERLMNTHWDKGMNGYGIQIKEFKIHTEYTYTAGHYNQNRSLWKESKLQAFAYKPISPPKEFCLCHLYTASLLDGGLKGQGYRASTDPTRAGGMCSPPWPGDPSTNLNAGVTPTRWDKDGLMIMGMVELITGDVIGTNWGAGRDNKSDSVCWPSDESGGGYIMSDVIIPSFPNNMEYSPCSKRSIAAVLRARADSCFVAPSTAPDPWFIQTDMCMNSGTRVGGSTISDSPFDEVKKFFTSHPVGAAMTVTSIALVPIVVYLGIRIHRWRHTGEAEADSSDLESSDTGSSSEASDVTSNTSSESSGTGSLSEASDVTSNTSSESSGTDSLSEASDVSSSASSDSSGTGSSSEASDVTSSASSESGTSGASTSRSS